MTSNRQHDTGDSVAPSFIPALIAKKRDGQVWRTSEIQTIVDAICDGSMEKAQIGALLMAVRLNGMTDEETIQLTTSMMHSGDVLVWPKEWRHLLVDKHSTGGVGDKVSLILAPALAACGCKVPMISGRGLGHTGGTLDKLESIPGFCSSQRTETIQAMLQTIGCCIVGQTARLVPADSVLYPIRDVTSTVDSIPLIAGSIVSKKAAEGLTALVLDIKLGKAAWSQDVSFIRHMAQTLVSVSNGLGIRTTGLITRMDSPLGHMVGNALEVIEAIQCLHGSGPLALTQLVCDQGGYLLYNSGHSSSPSEGSQKIHSTLQDGSAIAKFCAMVIAQGVNGDLAVSLCKKGMDAAQLLPQARHRTNVLSVKSGYIVEIDAMECALISNALGAGRVTTESIIDPAVGLQLIAHVGHLVNVGDVILTVHHNTPVPDDYVTRLQQSVTYSDLQPLCDDDCSLIVEVIECKN